MYLCIWLCGRGSQWAGLEPIYESVSLVKPERVCGRFGRHPAPARCEWVGWGELGGISAYVYTIHLSFAEGKATPLGGWI